MKPLSAKYHETKCYDTMIHQEDDLQDLQMVIPKRSIIPLPDNFKIGRAHV